ncbi:MAG: hypothetical protein JXA30_03290 [Deltaproteobacteria bacterium]|nr:hypothetical protein [Deltaproteobacteria bacterium]
MANRIEEQKVSHFIIRAYILLLLTISTILTSCFQSSDPKDSSGSNWLRCQVLDDCSDRSEAVACHEGYCVNSKGERIVQSLDVDAGERETVPDSPSDVDLTAFVDDMTRLCTGVFEGTIQDRPGSNDSVDFIPCEQVGKDYRLEIDAVAEMTCYGSEDQEGIDCTYANYGSFQLAGQLRVGADLVLEVSGNASIGPECGRCAPSAISCEYSLSGETVPHYTYEVRPEVMTSDQEDLELFSWSRRHSQDNEEPPVWEVCELSIEAHHQ